MLTYRSLPSPIVIALPVGAAPFPEPVRNSSRSFCCPIPDCGRAFFRDEHLQRHIRVHTGEKPFECDYPGCTSRFSRIDELQRHVKTHSRVTSRRRDKHDKMSITNLLNPKH
ncbi:DNA-binding protein creA [Paramicrosporidium saccamoebae]|uniref:DNA-binding protein creA n=1 Tax=Paramicrosporidium saccamoebae TaxID=1246581 RepID=A0A2H9TQN6_9FUNG|nr:DNA-binding protein creA [Paramicrosporidium saccamoebae]